MGVSITSYTHGSSSPWISFVCPQLKPAVTPNRPTLLPFAGFAHRPQRSFGLAYSMKCLKCLKCLKCFASKRLRTGTFRANQDCACLAPSTSGCLFGDMRPAKLLAAVALLRFLNVTQAKRHLPSVLFQLKERMAGSSKNVWQGHKKKYTLQT